VVLREQGTGNREQGTGKREWGIGVYFMSLKKALIKKKQFTDS
jgi:hypothetical protein